MNRQAIEWAAQQVKQRQLQDLNKPVPAGELWIDRAEWWPVLGPRHNAKYGPIRITPAMRKELRRYRMAAGLSAAALCRKVGLDQTHVGSIEGGSVTRTKAETWAELMAVCRTEIAARAVELDRIQQEWEAA